MDGIWDTWLKLLLISRGLESLNGEDPLPWFTKGQRTGFEQRADFSWPKCVIWSYVPRGEVVNRSHQTNKSSQTVSSSCEELKASSLSSSQRASAPSKDRSPSRLQTSLPPPTSPVPTQLHLCVCCFFTLAFYSVLLRFSFLPAVCGITISL